MNIIYREFFMIKLIEQLKTDSSSFFSHKDLIKSFDEISKNKDEIKLQDINLMF